MALDIAKGRVVECLQRVSDLMDLRTCADGVRSAIDQEDYELACRHIHKFLALDTTIFQMKDHEEVKGEQSQNKVSIINYHFSYAESNFFKSTVGQSMGKSYEILREAANEMKSIIEKRFDQVTSSLFPLFSFLD